MNQFHFKYHLITIKLYKFSIMKISYRQYAYILPCILESRNEQIVSVKCVFVNKRAIFHVAIIPSILESWDNLIFDRPGLVGGAWIHGCSWGRSTCPSLRGCRYYRNLSKNPWNEILTRLVTYSKGLFTFSQHHRFLIFDGKQHPQNIWFHGC